MSRRRRTSSSWIPAWSRAWRSVSTPSERPGTGPPPCAHRTPWSARPGAGTTSCRPSLMPYGRTTRSARSVTPSEASSVFIRRRLSSESSKRASTAPSEPPPKNGLRRRSQRTRVEGGLDDALQASPEHQIAPAEPLERASRPSRPPICSQLRSRRSNPEHRLPGRLTTAILLAAALFLGSGGPASAGVADQVGATFGLMIQDVVSAFPAVEGLVVAVEGDRVFLDLTQKDGVQPGQEFTVFRKGEVFRHPINGKALGRFEDVLGHAQIQRVLAQFSEATYVPLEGKPEPRPEDGVRITKGRIRVAVAPPTDLTKTNGDLRRVPFMIAHALAETKRFQTADPSAVQELLLSQKTRSEELLVRPDKAVAVAKPLEVVGWIVPVLLERRGIMYLDVTWVSAVTGTALFSRRLALIRVETASEQRFPWEPIPQD